MIRKARQNCSSQQFQPAQGIPVLDSWGAIVPRPPGNAGELARTTGVQPVPSVRIWRGGSTHPFATAEGLHNALWPASRHRSQATCNTPEGSRNSPPLPPSDPLYSPPRPMSIFPEVNALPFCQPKVCFRAGPGAPCGSGPCACLFRRQRDGGHVPEIPITVPDCLPSLNSVYPVCNAPPPTKKRSACSVPEVMRRVYTCGHRNGSSPPRVGVRKLSGASSSPSQSSNASPRESPTPFLSPNRVESTTERVVLKHVALSRATTGRSGRKASVCKSITLETPATPSLWDGESLFPITPQLSSAPSTLVVPALPGADVSTRAPRFGIHFGV